jgi:hypothetical protein
MSCTWKAFQRRQYLRGLWIDFTEPTSSGLKIRLLGKINHVRWGKTQLAMDVTFLKGKDAGRWRKLWKPLERCMVFDFSSSKSGVRILGRGCFRWASMDGRSCTIAPEFKNFGQLPRRRSHRVLSRLASKQIKALHADH